MVALEERVWNVILKLWQYPRIARPEIHESVSDVPDILKNELAGYVLEDRTIHVNKEKLRAFKGYNDDWLVPISAHEVGHHALCPYSPAMSLRLTGAAEKVLKDWNAAQFAENLFDDLLVNTFIYRNDRIIGSGLVEILGSMDEMKSSKLGKFYLRSYEILWSLPAETLVSSVPKEINFDAEMVASILRDDTFMSNTWVEKITGFSRLLKKYMNDDSHGPCRCRSAGEYGDVLQALEELSQELPIKRLKEITVGLGIGSAELAERLFYLGNARGYSLQLPRARTKSGELYPSSPSVWQPNDPVSKLNIPYSLQRSGILVPGVTTQQWALEYGDNFAEELSHPDLCIIIDSSGSMPNPSNELSYTVLSGVVASESAINAGCRVAVVNFSGEGACYVVKYTLDRDEVLNGLLRYFSGGTYFPCDDFSEIVASNDRAQHILMMSDGQVRNPTEWVDAMANALKRAGSGTLFLAAERKGSKKKENTEWSHSLDELEAVGYKIWPMQTSSDLLAVVQADAKELYG